MHSVTFMPPLPSTPLVTVGLPVYNGGQYIAEALATLAAQDYPNFEIVVSDNASTDDTQKICQELAARDGRLRYARNAENIGPLKNFRAVLGRAQGQYFMWAAHDDKWDPRFISSLVSRLRTDPHAVLATPTILHVEQDGRLRSEPPDRPAPGTSGIDNLKILFDDHAPSWIYGLWHTDWLREHLDELDSYPLWGGDVLWLADVCLRYKVVGNQDALLYKRLRRSSYAPQTARAAVTFWAYMFWHASAISVRRTTGLKIRLVTLLISWRYVYRLCIRRPNIVRTAWRVVRMLLVAAITGLGVGALRLWQRATGGPKSKCESGNSASTATNGDESRSGRRAA